MAQRPPMYQTSQDQRWADADDDRYFADLRAAPPDDPWAMEDGLGQERSGVDLDWDDGRRGGDLRTDPAADRDRSAGYRRGDRQEAREADYDQGAGYRPGDPRKASAADSGWNEGYGREASATDGGYRRENTDEGWGERSGRAAPAPGGDWGNDYRRETSAAVGEYGREVADGGWDDGRGASAAVGEYGREVADGGWDDRREASAADGGWDDGREGADGGYGRGAVDGGRRNDYQREASAVDGGYRRGDSREMPVVDLEWDDGYRRSDLLIESNTDPTGWKATGPAQPPIPDDRPPAEAVSGNRLLTVLLFFAGLATSVSLWLFDTKAGAVHDTPTTMLAAGRITGLIAGYLLFIQLLMMSRVSWLEEWVGARDLLRWHRWLGTSLVVGVLTHIVFITYGYALTAHAGVVGQAWTIVTTFPSMLSAVAATVILVVISLISIRAARAKLPYELWHLIHLTSYLILLLGYSHQVATGADLSGRFASVFWPGLTALVISALVWGRLIEPVWLNARHRFQVAEVVSEGANTFSIYIDGKNLDRLPAQAGQFMRWRFLTSNGWWQSHPFSLSAAPNSRWLRLTVTAVGGHTRKLATMRPGTPIWAEGPFGTFTAQRRTRRRALLIAGGSGIAPIRALLEDMPADTIVIYRASRPEELVFRGELEELAERRDAWVRYIVGSRNDPGPRRLFTPSGLLGLVPDVSRRDVYLCGPPGLVGAAVNTLRGLKVPDSQLHLDPFEF